METQSPTFEGVLMADGGEKVAGFRLPEGGGGWSEGTDAAEASSWLCS